MMEIIMPDLPFIFVFLYFAIAVITFTTASEETNGNGIKSASIGLFWPLWLIAFIIKLFLRTCDWIQKYFTQ